MLLTLPDKSVAELHPATLRFAAILDGPLQRPSAVTPDPGEKAPFGVNCKTLAKCMEAPLWRFADCFRRVSNHPRYSPKQSVHSFDVKFLSRIYKFPGSYQGGTFSSSTTEWRFLDGGIISQNGYGWGNHSWTVVEGAEALRSICLFFGIAQPLLIKGEGSRRSLSMLLEEMTKVPLQDASRGPLSHIWPTETAGNT